MEGKKRRQGHQPKPTAAAGEQIQLADLQQLLSTGTPASTATTPTLIEDLPEAATVTQPPPLGQPDDPPGTTAGSPASKATTPTLLEDLPEAAAAQPLPLGPPDDPTAGSPEPRRAEVEQAQQTSCWFFNSSAMSTGDPQQVDIELEDLSNINVDTPGGESSPPTEGGGRIWTGLASRMWTGLKACFSLLRGGLGILIITTL